MRVGNSKFCRSKKKNMEIGKSEPRKLILKNISVSKINQSIQKYQSLLISKTTIQLPIYRLKKQIIGLLMFGKNTYRTESGVITGYSNQHGNIQRELRRIIRNALLVVIICLLFKKFATDGVPSWYSIRRDTSLGAIDPDNNSPIFNETMTDFDDYNVIDIKRLIIFIIICITFTVPFFL